MLQALDISRRSPDEMIMILQTEVQLLKNRATVLEQGRFTVRHTEPAKLEEGMLVVADGTDWDPGSGAGAYLYLGAAWSKL